MARTQISRRSMLRGVLAGSAVAIGLPALEIFYPGRRDVLAQGGFPRRFGIFFWGNGMIPSRWTPTVEGADWGLSYADQKTLPYGERGQLYPLWENDVHQDVTVVTGMSVMTASTVAHGSGASGIFSGTSLNNGSFPGQSIDQRVADAIGSGTIYRSIETSCEVNNAAALTGPSWSFQDANSQNPSAASPHLLFDRIFGANFVEPGGTPVIDPKNALRRSVLDAVGDDVRRLQRRVGRADKTRLDQHLSSIRALELRLALLDSNPPSFASCRRPTEPPVSFPLDRENRIDLRKINAAFAEIHALALACDLTRVFSHWMTGSVSSLRFPEYEAVNKVDAANQPIDPLLQVSGHHQLTHDEPGDQPYVHEIVLNVMDQYAAMIKAMKGVPEGNGTLLDNMVLFATSDCSLGRQHRLADYPILLAGSAGGKLRQGIHYKSSGENASKVLLSIAQAVGLQISEFGGDAGLTTSGLSAIEV